MAKELATQLIEQFQAAGVRRLYGIIGDSLNPLADAVRKAGRSSNGGIAWIHVRRADAGRIALIRNGPALSNRPSRLVDSAEDQGRAAASATKKLSPAKEVPCLSLH